MDAFERYHLDAVMGGAVLLYVVFGRWSEAKFRRSAVVVSGEVKAVRVHRHFTSHFVAYEFEGQQRVAEYCCSSPKAKEVGSTLRLLIDPKAPPDGEVPEGAHDSPGVPAGNCSLEGEPLMSLVDWFFLLAGLFAIAHSFW